MFSPTIEQFHVLPGHVVIIYKYIIKLGFHRKNLSKSENLPECTLVVYTRVFNYVNIASIIIEGPMQYEYVDICATVESMSV